MSQHDLDFLCHCVRCDKWRDKGLFKYRCGPICALCERKQERIRSGLHRPQSPQARSALTVKQRKRRNSPEYVAEKVAEWQTRRRPELQAEGFQFGALAVKLQEELPAACEEMGVDFNRLPAHMK